MIQILGAACAYPSTAISERLLSECPVSESSMGKGSLIGKVGNRSISAGIRNRWSVLPEEYIRTSGNSDKFEGAAVATATPTDLGYVAALEALKRAGIERDALGLVLGDAANPLETCPSEGQRVGGRLGLKIEAFDMVLADAGLPGYLSTLGSWKSDRFPDYVLCVASSTPTRAVRYDGGEARYFLGDAVAAAVISLENRGRFITRSSRSNASRKQSGSSDRTVRRPGDRSP